MRGIIPPTSQFVFMVWCLINHRVNFVFTFASIKVVSLSRWRLEPQFISNEQVHPSEVDIQIAAYKTHGDPNQQYADSSFCSLFAYFTMIITCYVM